METGEGKVKGAILLPLPPPSSPSPSPPPSPEELLEVLEEPLRDVEAPLKGRLLSALELGVAVDIAFLLENDGEEEEVVYAHKLMLRVATKELAELVDYCPPGGMVKLKGISPKEFRKLIKFLYTDDVEKTGVKDFLDLAVSFGFRKLPGKLLEQVKESLCTRRGFSELVVQSADLLEQIIYALNLARYCDDNELADNCIKALIRNFWRVLEDEAELLLLKEVRKEDLKIILSADDLNVKHGEEDVYNTLIKWASFKLTVQNNTPEEMRRLLSEGNLKFSLRFHLLPPYYLEDGGTIKWGGLIERAGILSALELEHVRKLVKAYQEDNTEVPEEIDNPFGIVFRERKVAVVTLKKRKIPVAPPPPIIGKKRTPNGYHDREDKWEGGKEKKLPLKDEATKNQCIPLVTEKRNSRKLSIDSSSSDSLGATKENDSPPNLEQRLVEEVEENLPSRLFLRNGVLSHMGVLARIQKRGASSIKEISIQDVKILFRKDRGWTPKTTLPRLNSFDYHAQENEEDFVKKKFLGSVPSLLDFLPFEPNLARNSLTIRTSAGTHLRLADGKIILGHPKPKDSAWVLNSIFHLQPLKMLCLSGTTIPDPSVIPSVDLETVILWDVKMLDNTSIAKFLNRCPRLRRLSAWESSGKPRLLHLSTDLTHCRETLESLALSHFKVPGPSEKLIQCWKKINQKLPDTFACLKHLYLNCSTWNQAFLTNFNKLFPELCRFGFKTRNKILECKVIHDFAKHEKLLEILVLKLPEAGQEEEDEDEIFLLESPATTTPEEKESRLWLEGLLQEGGMSISSLTKGFVLRRDEPHLNWCLEETSDSALYEKHWEWLGLRDLFTAKTLKVLEAKYKQQTQTED